MSYRPAVKCPPHPLDRRDGNQISKTARVVNKIVRRRLLSTRQPAVVCPPRYHKRGFEYSGNRIAVAFVKAHRINLYIYIICL
jgi:hypothetical protein